MRKILELPHLGSKTSNVDQSILAQLKLGTNICDFQQVSFGHIDKERISGYGAFQHIKESSCVYHQNAGRLDRETNLKFHTCQLRSKTNVIHEVVATTICNHEVAPF